MTRPLIVISELMSDAAVAKLCAACDVRYDARLADERVRLLAAVAEASALIVRNRTSVDAELLAAAPCLTVVGRLGVGLDNIDVDVCRRRGIEVIPAMGANAQSVAEYVIASALLLLRPALVARGEVASGAWPRARLAHGRELCGKMLGLVGCGNIGQATARLAGALGMSVCGYDPLIPADSTMWATVGIVRLDFPPLLERADVVSLHVPLSDGTRDLFNAAAIAQMKKGAVLVNTSRGGILDEVALVRALTSGSLAGAALDVFETEPLPAGSPLAAAPNLLLTPHIAGLTVESNERVSSLIADRVLACLSAPRPSERATRPTG